MLTIITSRTWPEYFKWPGHTKCLVWWSFVFNLPTTPSHFVHPPFGHPMPSIYVFQCQFLFICIYQTHFTLQYIRNGPSRNMYWMCRDLGKCNSSKAQIKYLSNAFQTNQSGNMLALHFIAFHPSLPLASSFTCNSIQFHSFLLHCHCRKSFHLSNLEAGWQHMINITRIYVNCNIPSHYPNNIRSGVEGKLLPNGFTLPLHLISYEW